MQENIELALCFIIMNRMFIAYYTQFRLKDPW